MSRNLKHLDRPVERNAAQWKSISYFLAGFEMLVQSEHARRAGGAPRAGGSCAQRGGLQAIPDGNHGDNRRSIK